MMSENSSPSLRARIGNNATELIFELLRKQLEHYKAKDKLEEAGIDLEGTGIQFHVLDIIADFIGIPKDNTVEVKACERAYETGKWPEDAICRDWILDEWFDVEDGKKSIDDFVEKLLEGKDYYEKCRMGDVDDGT